MRYGIYLLIFLSVFLGRGGRESSFAQQKTVRYDKDFSFREGIYFTFLDFKNNNPVPSSRVVSGYNKNDRDFFKNILSKITFTYIDGFGNQVVYNSNDIWGYCSNGTVYISHGTDYNRITIIGSISHFVATVQMKIGVSDPFMNNQGFGNQQQYTYVSEQFVLDFESGSVFEFNVEHMEYLLHRDDVLYNEFMALKRKQKRDGIFLYLRKYNEKHPVYFPE